MRVGTRLTRCELILLESLKITHRTTQDLKMVIKFIHIIMKCIGLKLPVQYLSYRLSTLVYECYTNVNILENCC
jgi:hypothetical protein